MNEQQIQSKIIKRLEADGYFVIKLIRTNKVGIPDLIAVKENDFFFVEVKTPNGRLSEIQKYRIKEIESFNVKVLLMNK